MSKSSRNVISSEDSDEENESIEQIDETLNSNEDASSDNIQEISNDSIKFKNVKKVNPALARVTKEIIQETPPNLNKVKKTAPRKSNDDSEEETHFRLKSKKAITESLDSSNDENEFFTPTPFNESETDHEIKQTVIKKMSIKNTPNLKNTKEVEIVSDEDSEEEFYAKPKAKNVVNSDDSSEDDAKAKSNTKKILASEESDEVVNLDDYDYEDEDDESYEKSKSRNKLSSEESDEEIVTKPKMKQIFALEESEEVVNSEDDDEEDDNEESYEEPKLSLKSKAKKILSSEESYENENSEEDEEEEEKQIEFKPVPKKVTNRSFGSNDKSLRLVLNESEESSPVLGKVSKLETRPASLRKIREVTVINSEESDDEDSIDAKPAYLIDNSLESNYENDSMPVIVDELANNEPDNEIVNPVIARVSKTVIQDTPPSTYQNQEIIELSDTEVSPKHKQIPGVLSVSNKKIGDQRLLTSWTEYLSNTKEQAPNIKVKAPEIKQERQMKTLDLNNQELNAKLAALDNNKKDSMKELKMQIGNSLVTNRNLTSESQLKALSEGMFENLEDKPDADSSYEDIKMPTGLKVNI